MVGALAALLALAAVLALVVGGVVGRSIVPAPESTPDAAGESAPAQRPATVRFKDTLTDVSIAYPSTWVRQMGEDQAVRILASSPDGSAAVSVSVRKAGLEPVTPQTLPVVRPLTEDLLRADRDIEKIGEPVAVTVDGVPGYRYVYTYRRADGRDGAHVHYFLFTQQGRLIQIVLEAVPASRLPALQPTFDRIADSFRVD